MGKWLAENKHTIYCGFVGLVVGSILAAMLYLMTCIDRGMPKPPVP